MEYAYVHWSNMAKALERVVAGRGSEYVPRGIDCKKLRMEYRRKALDINREYLKRYLHRYKTFRGGSWCSIQVRVDMYFYDLARHLKVSKASDARIRQAITDYAKWLDKYPAEAIHSDFLKLWMIGQRGDRSGFLETLRGMQKQHPDATAVYWRRGSRWANTMLYQLFRMDTSKNTFRQWLDGKRGPGDLPYVGYDPNKDKHTPTARPRE